MRSRSARWERNCTTGCETRWHITGVGTNLDRAVEAYNQAVGSLENRVLVSARKFAELGASVAEDIPELEPIETTARALSFEWDEEPAETSDNDGRRIGSGNSLTVETFARADQPDSLGRIWFRHFYKSVIMS